MTLAELAVTIGVLGVLGLTASRFGLSAIPAYLFAGIILGPNEPDIVQLVQPSEVTHFVSEIGLIFLLFFLGLEFSLERLVRSGRHVGLGGAADLIVNAGLGLLVGLIAFGPSFAALVLAACIYVSSSAIAVKALIDFRRLADDETDLVLAILLFEDIAIAAVLGFVATGGGGVAETAGVTTKAFVFVAGVARSLALPRRLDRPAARQARARVLPPRRVRLRDRDECDRDGARALRGDRRADGGRDPVGERRARGDRAAVLRDARHLRRVVLLRVRADDRPLALERPRLDRRLAIVATLIGKLGVGVVAGRLGGFSVRQGINAGAALVAHGEFTIILAQLAAGNAALSLEQRDDIVAFAGLYVLASATVGVVLMKESKRLGRMLRPAVALE